MVGQQGHHLGVTAKGLTNGSELTQYTHSLNGDAYGNALHASAEGDWLFGLGEMTS